VSLFINFVTNSLTSTKEANRGRVNKIDKVAKLTFSFHLYGLLGENLDICMSCISCMSCCYQRSYLFANPINKCKENKNKCKIKRYYEPENKCMCITSQIFITIFKPQMCCMMRLWSTKMCIRLFIVKHFIDRNCWKS
jgi:hypothetical protein